MPWLRLDDIGYDDPLVRALCAKDNSAYGALTRMGQYTATHRLNGWIPMDKAREIGSTRDLRALLTVRIGDSAPALHQRGDECRCMTGWEWPHVEGYLLHGFLDRNPSKDENDVHRAKARELKDKALRAAVKRRDADLCRYCAVTVRWADRKTAQGGVLDHVDPRKAAGADNLVVACRGCNGRKKDCTPAEAGMVLLPVPSADAEQPSGSTPDQPPINVGSTTDQPPDQNPAPDQDVDPAPRPNPATVLPATEPATNDNPADLHTDRSTHPTNGRINGPMTVGTGRGGPRRESPPPATAGDAGPEGHRTTIGPATTPRDALTPNPYFKASTSNPQPDDPRPPGGER